MENAESSMGGTSNTMGNSRNFITAIFGSISIQFLGVAAKYFQTVDNIANYDLINIPHSKMLKLVFDFVGSISQPPQFSKDAWLDANEGRLTLQYFPNSRFKISKKFKEGFIEKTSTNFIVYLVYIQLLTV